MAKLIMMRGLPASGKTTKAEAIIKKDGNYVRLNRDLLRKMLHFGKFTGRNEGITQDVQLAMARELLAKNIGVIIDDTNLGEKHKMRWLNLTKEMKAKFEMIAMDTSPSVCIIRDAVREAKVGEDVIMNMALQYGLYTPEKAYILCDLDGTICNIDHRLHYVSDETKDWKGFFSEIHNDSANLETTRIVKNYYKNGYSIILVTARPEKYKQETLEWLKKYNVFFTTLIMRRNSDKRPDVDVKRDILNTYFHDRNAIKLVIDDRPSVIRMWREERLTVMDVGKGVEF